jgi:hypothetical protein
MLVVGSLSAEGLRERWMLKILAVPAVALQVIPGSCLFKRILYIVMSNRDFRTNLQL